MKSKIKWIYVCLLTLFLQIGYAQEKTLSGVVSEGGMPLPGVTVVIQGTQLGTQTDLNGKYSIKAKPGQVLVFSFIGLKETKYTVGAANAYNVAMTTDASELGEVVVLAYGQVRKKNEVTGNVVAIKGDVVAETPIVSADQALQGRVAGLQMATTSGSPGSVQNIRIRGRNSVSATNEPLYVIDGVPVINANLSHSTDVTSLSPLASINPDDIESMTVLKDAGATSVYGARGSNGVILITTKKGKQGKPSYNFRSSVGFQNNAVKGPKFLSGEQRAELWIEAIANGNNLDKNDVKNNYKNIIGEDLYTYWDDNGRQVYDWQEQVRVKNAPMSSLSFSVNGGDEKGTYFASLGHDKTQGVIIGTDFRRVTGSFNFTKKLSDKIDIKIGANVSNIKQNGISEGGAFFGNPNVTSKLMTPWASPYNSDGSYNTSNALLGGELPNSLYIVANDISRNDMTRVVSSNSFGYKILENLKFESVIGLDYTLANYQMYQNSVHGDGVAYGGMSGQADRKVFNYVWQNSLNYNFAIGSNHRFDIRALMEFQKNKYNKLYADGQVLPPGLITLGSSAANYTATSQYYDWSQLSYLGLLNYSYANKYLIDLTVRREGSSRFSGDDRWGTFWSAGVAWNIHQEEFLMNSNVISTLRLRGSYGATGNSSIDPNVYQHLLKSVSYNNEAGLSSKQIGGKLGWEKQDKLDFGLEFGLFNDRVTGGIAFYQSKTRDLLYKLPLSYTTGFDYKWINQGKLENKGFEAELDVKIINNKDFKWSIGGNVGVVKNELTEMPTAYKSYTADKVGKMINEWYMPEWAGVDPQTGAAQWYAADGSKTSNYGKAESRFQGASALPKVTGGVNTHIEYKGFYADALFSFATGYKVYDYWSQVTSSPDGTTLYGYNGVDYLMDRWQKPGDITDVPILTDGPSAGNQYFTSPSTRFLYDGDHIRLRQLTVGYNLSNQAAKTIGLDGVNFSVAALNPFTWVKDSKLKFDPEVDATGYVEFASPPLRSVVFSVNVKF
ncbi:MAG: TonB-dependent receptor [Flavobacteriaceae bacterium]|jgi:TonB-linked SusC/RagA family outer membrane protein|nr:TonB-dependent receptor [Flavobacteriaceae bacterium]